PPTGVHQGERAAAPVGVVGHPVPGDARGVFDDRLAAAENPVDQGGLADVGAPYHRDHGGGGAGGGGVRFSGAGHGHGPPVRAGRLASGKPRSPATRTISAMTWPRLRTVESTLIASLAITDCGASAVSRRFCSSRVTAGVAAGSADRSALRRAARASSLAVRNTFTTACGATTVPMSRPSATIPSPAAQARARMPCCCAIRCARTSGTDATALTALDTSRLRISPVTSVPSTVTAGRAGSVVTSITGRRACPATVAGSPTSRPWLISHQVSARYIAPVSR